MQMICFRERETPQQDVCAEYLQEENVTRIVNIVIKTIYSDGFKMYIHTY